MSNSEVPPTPQINLAVVVKLLQLVDYLEEQPIIPHKEIRDLSLEEILNQLLVGDSLPRVTPEDKTRGSLVIIKISSKQVSRTLKRLMNL
jgi:hypothetical protein